MRMPVFIVLLFQLFICMPAHAQEISSVTVCYDPISPITTAAQKRTSDDQFFNRLIINTFARIGIKARYITEYPFKRCMAEVESQRIDFVLGAYFDSERAKLFDYSSHYYTLTPQVFFLRHDRLSLPGSVILIGIAAAAYTARAMPITV